jgi:hypothetical protein
MQMDTVECNENNGEAGQEINMMAKRNADEAEADCTFNLLIRALTGSPTEQPRKNQPASLLVSKTADSWSHDQGSVPLCKQAAVIHSMTLIS